MVKNPPDDTEDTVRSLIQEDPTGLGATKRMRHNYGACGLEPRSHSYRSLQTLQPMLHNKRRHRNEKPEHRNEEQRCCLQLEKSPAQSKINNFKKKKKKAENDLKIGKGYAIFDWEGFFGEIWVITWINWGRQLCKDLELKHPLERDEWSEEEVVRMTSEMGRARPHEVWQGCHADFLLHQNQKGWL